MGRGILAVLLLLAGIFGAIQVFYPIGVGIDGLTQSEQVVSSQPFSPVTFASGLAATALVIPWSMLIHRWLHGVPGPAHPSTRSNPAYVSTCSGGRRWPSSPSS